MEDNEKTFPELYERIEKTLAVLKKAKKATFIAPVRSFFPHPHLSREISFAEL